MNVRLPSKFKVGKHLKRQFKGKVVEVEGRRSPEDDVSETERTGPRPHIRRIKILYHELVD